MADHIEPHAPELTPITVWFGMHEATINADCEWTCSSAAVLAQLQAFTKPAFDASGAAAAGGHAYYWCAVNAEDALNGRMTDAPDAAVPDFEDPDRIA